MLLLMSHLVHCARIRHVELHEETLTLLYSSPVKRIHLRNHAVGDHAELLTTLHGAINASWQEYSLGRSASSFQLNDDFFDFQRDEYGETQPERGWLATKAGGRLLSVVTSVAQAYLKELHVEAPALSAGDFHVWTSVHSSCSIHPIHVHPGATLSGVLYVATEPDDGQLVFADPRGTLPPFDDHRLGFRPAPGDILIFPPWLPHEVTSSGRCGSAVASVDSPPRISISFNLLADRSYEQLQWGRSTAQYSHPVRTGEGSTCSDHTSRVPQSSTMASETVADKGTKSAVGDIARRLVSMRDELAELGRKAQQLHGDGAEAVTLRQSAPRAHLHATQQALEGILYDSATLFERLLGSQIRIEIQD